MALQGEEIRRRLSEFAAVWGGYAGTEKAEAQTFLNGLLECYGTDRRAEGARFEERTADGFMDLFWPGVCIVEMKRPSEARKLPQHREQMLRYWQSSGTPAIPAPRYVVLCAFHRFEVWEPGALLDASQSGFVRRAEVGWKKVEANIEKVSRRYVTSGVARLGYVVVSEECDWGFPADFVARMEAQHPGCLLRFVRAWR